MSDQHTSEAKKTVREIKKNLIKEIDQFGKRLPANVLDTLFNDLDGPVHVAELTGRKRRLVKKQNGQFEYQSRALENIPLDSINLREKDDFVFGKKKVAIISDAASTGISLHNDRNIETNRRRVQIILELPWSADRAIQQFGRTHRSNQFNAPK